MYEVVAGEICGQYIVHASVYVYVYKIFIKTMCARMYIYIVLHELVIKIFYY